MGWIGSILSFSRAIANDAKISEVKIDRGGGTNITAEHFSSIGDDSFPLETDFVILQQIKRSGGFAVVGYIDPSSEPKAQKGDKRIYARDANGTLKAEVWLKNDGTIVINNGSGSFLMEASGKVIINGLEIDTNGNLTTTGTVKADIIEGDSSVLAAGKELVDHTHAQANDSGGNTEQPTGPNQ